jgi:hypothetical protein
MGDKGKKIRTRLGNRKTGTNGKKEFREAAG